MSNKVMNSMETNIIFKITVYRDEEERNTLQVPSERGESKSQK